MYRRYENFKDTKDTKDTTESLNKPLVTMRPYLRSIVFTVLPKSKETRDSNISFKTTEKNLLIAEASIAGDCTRVVIDSGAAKSYVSRNYVSATE